MGCAAAGPVGGPPKLAARFVRDVTIFDGTQMAPGTAFTKIWRLKNVGEVPWPPGTRMLFVGGDQMTSEMSVPLSRTTPVLPGEEVAVAAGHAHALCGRRSDDQRDVGAPLAHHARPPGRRGCRGRRARACSLWAAIR